MPLDGFYAFFNRDNADRKECKSLKASVLPELMWAFKFLFHRLIHIFCGIAMPSPEHRADRT